MGLKNKKKYQKAHISNVDLGEDKISNLPDPLIHHILSLLSTKCGMSTCILSKRWKPLSNSIPILDFREWRAQNCSEEEKHVKTQQFMNFLDTVFYVHEKPNIQKFCLKWDRHFDESRVSKWIGTTIKRKVEELFLSGSGVSLTSFKFPLSFFTCDSLTVLYLESIRLKLPNTVMFPKLKLLKLRFVVFMNGDSIKKLLSSCPILEDLSLINCDDELSKGACITKHTLKNLCISDSYLYDYTMKICAPNLSTICCEGEAENGYVFDSFPSLVEADIGVFYIGEFPLQVETYVLMLFGKLSNAKVLKMSGDSFQILCSLDVLFTSFPGFDNLTHLEVTSEFECTSSDSWYKSMRVLIRFLHLSPNLESIVFAKCIDYPGEEHEDYRSLDLECSLLRLRSIKFNYFNGEPGELNAIKLFLKYVVVLDTMTIVASPSLSGNYESQTKATRQLLMFPRPANCVVKFLLSSENI